jgi:decaprenyl-phosphate phosphoribosyltransferase
VADKNESPATVSDKPEEDEVAATSEAGAAGDTDVEGAVGTEQEIADTAASPSQEADEAARKAGTLSGLLTGLVREARPKQWVKNVLVVAVPFLAHGINDPQVMAATGMAFVVFCMAASGIYFVNDAKDVESDRAHPTKRFRPIAAGLVPLPVAYVVAFLLLAGSIAVAATVSLQLTAVMITYVAVQLGYCYGLKHQPVIDMCIVSSGFLLRVVAGGAAATLGISQWFMLVTAFGSLFMVAGKRYAEIIYANRTGAKIRKSLESYSASYLRFVWATSAAMVIVNYSLWAYQQHEIARVWSALSIVPFVVAILRYAVDVDRGSAGEPEEVVLKDKVMIVLGVLLAACLFMLFYGDSVKALIGVA